ncbi:hypothetical protein ACFFKU_02400 [Kineococcus gynurae]|uniref:Anti-sigma factor n=1 Tax=Kineococcus gynurae TaxID=452979 RepID=A0ABV5LSJ5_9ACTN
MGEPDGAVDRRAELLGAALGGDLDEQERRELDELLRTDPSAAADLAELGAVLDRLPPRGSGWIDTTPPATVPPVTFPPPAPARRPSHHRGRWRLALAAALLLGAGFGGGILTAALGDRPVEGPPGTLGAVETLTVSGAPEGVRASTAVVAHTWGTETVLDVSGLAVGEVFTVDVVGTDGRTETAGSFLGSTVPVECRMNAALLREDVTEIQIRDLAGDVVFRSALPPVSGTRA